MTRKMWDNAITFCEKSSGSVEAHSSRMNRMVDLGAEHMWVIVRECSVALKCDRKLTKESALIERIFNRGTARVAGFIYIAPILVEISPEIR